MNKQFGFTLTEVLFALAVGGILLAIALPNYQTMVKNNCLTTTANSLVSSFQQARSEAVKRNSLVTITAANAAAATNKWGLGWVITINEDRNNNGVLDFSVDTNADGVPDAGGEDYDGDGVLDNAALVRTVNLTCGTTTVDEIDPTAAVNPGDDTANDTVFVYQPNGFIDYPGTFNICDDRTGETGKQITISTVGRPNTNSNFTGCL